MYRIGREAVTNAFRHSRASKIEVELQVRCQNVCGCLFAIMACGIDQAVVRTGLDGHWGLSGMRERAEEIGAKLQSVEQRLQREPKLSCLFRVGLRSDRDLPITAGDGCPN